MSVLQGNLTPLVLGSGWWADDERAVGKERVAKFSASVSQDVRHHLLSPSLTLHASAHFPLSSLAYFHGSVPWTPRHGDRHASPRSTFQQAQAKADPVLYFVSAEKVFTFRTLRPFRALIIAPKAQM